MTVPIRFLPEVATDLSEAHDWYDRQQSGLGDQFLAEVETALERIQRAPGAYAELHRGVRRPLTHRFPYGVSFRIEAEQLIVVAVLHCHRDPQLWRERA